MPQPYKVFTIYAREDAQYLDELRGQLRPLENAGRIKVWSDREINPGVDWEKEIVRNLDTADIILILVSSAYFNSAYIHDVEIKYALSRHEKGEAKVLPIIVRPCAFGDDPVISRLQALPTDGHPVTDRRHWHERDEAWLDVVAGLKRTIDLMREAETHKEQDARNVEERKRRVAEQKKADAERAARERSERERREIVQRTKEEQERREREAETMYRSEELERRIQENRERYARQITWEIKKKQPSFAIIGGSVFVLIFVIWLLLRMFYGDEKGEAIAVKILSPTLSEYRDSLMHGKSGFEMALVQGGTFDMGDVMGDNSDSDEKPVHSVTLSSFYLSKTELTLREFKTFIDDTRYKTDAEKGGGSYIYNGSSWVTENDVNWRHDEQGNVRTGDNHPVIHVSWNDAVTYCNWLSEKQGLTKVYTFTGDKVTADWNAGGYRLPTEAEWEFAARQRGQKVRFGNGKDIADPKEINFNGSIAFQKTYSTTVIYRQKTVPVGSLNSPNAVGLHDMSGNVWEWCFDWYGSYSSGSQTNPTGPTSGSGCVLRGGSWGSYPQYCRVVDRDYGAPGYRYSDTGFRLARTK